MPHGIDDGGGWIHWQTTLYGGVLYFTLDSIAPDGLHSQGKPPMPPPCIVDGDRGAARIAVIAHGRTVIGPALLAPSAVHHGYRVFAAIGSCTATRGPATLTTAMGRVGSVPLRSPYRRHAHALFPFRSGSLFLRLLSKAFFYHLSPREPATDAPMIPSRLCPRNRKPLSCNLRRQWCLRTSKGRGAPTGTTIIRLWVPSRTETLGKRANPGFNLEKRKWEREWGDLSKRVFTMGGGRGNTRAMALDAHAL